VLCAATSVLVTIGTLPESSSFKRRREHELAIEKPEIIPNRPEAKIVTFAGPPEKRPAIALARSLL